MDKETLKEEVVSALKKVYRSSKGLHINARGIAYAKFVGVVLLIPILALPLQYLYIFFVPYVDVTFSARVDMGLKIVNGIYSPSVLTVLLGLLALFIDKDNNGVPDELEDKLSSREENRKDV